MKITALLASAILIGSTQGQSHIREVDVAVSSDPNRQCEMFPPTGTLSVKVYEHDSAPLLVFELCFCRFVENIAALWITLVASLQKE